MENLFSISISDFNEKIYFLNKKTNFSYDIAIKNIRNINKKLKTSYLPEHINKNLEMKLMDSLVNSKLKIKISILGEIIVNMLYDSAVDLYLINQINQRLIEALYNITKTKKIKIDMLVRRYNEVIVLLDETLYMMDPRIRLCNKPENLNICDIIPHSVYVQKFNKATLNSRSIAFYISSNNFTTVRKNTEINKKLKEKEEKISLAVNDNILKQYKIAKMQRLNSFTNNKNVINLGVDKDLLLENKKIAINNKNIDKNGFVDLTAFNSGDLIQKKKMGDNNMANFIGEFNLSPNVNKVKNNGNNQPINLHAFSSMGTDSNRKPGFDNLEFVFQNQNQGNNNISNNNPINNFYFDNNFQNQKIDPNIINADNNRYPNKNSLFDFTNQSNAININQPIQDNFNFDNAPNNQFFNINNASEFNNYPMINDNTVNIINETVIHDDNLFSNKSNIEQFKFNNNNNINNLNMLNPLAISNFEFNNPSQQQKNINPDNPEDILMDQNFWNILPNKKNENTTANQNINNMNSNNAKNNQSNFFKNSIDFNFNNTAAPSIRNIPEFNFDLPNKQQAPFETSFNINNITLLNNNLNDANNMSNINKSSFSNFNINNFDMNNKGVPKNNFNQNFIGNNNINANPGEFGRKQNSFDFNFVNLLQNDTFKLQEDEFDPNNIRKQIRGAIIEKGMILNNKGVYDEIKYRGQFALELTNNFAINNKSLFLRILNSSWNDPNMFVKKIPDGNLVNEENSTLYKICCKNAKNTLRLIEYNINIKQIEPGADFKVVGKSKDNKYKLEILGILNKKNRAHMKSSSMTITIILKNNTVKLSKSTHNDYILEDKKITIDFPNFSQQEKHLVGMMFDTNEPDFVEMVKISYKYMEILPTNMNAEVYFYDKNNNMNFLDLAKKCMVEIRFNL